MFWYPGFGPPKFPGIDHTKHDTDKKHFGSQRIEYSGGLDVRLACIRGCHRILNASAKDTSESKASLPEGNQD